MRLFSVAEGSLEIFVTQVFADDGQADAAIDEFGGVGVTAIELLLNQAEHRQQIAPRKNYLGAVLQHLVGAKLTILLGEQNIIWRPICTNGVIFMSTGAPSPLSNLSTDTTPLSKPTRQTAA
jgi:hypothetical protein